MAEKGLCGGYLLAAKWRSLIEDGYTFIDHHGWSAYNEAEDLLPHLRAYKRRYGCLPEFLEADRIYLNRRNRRILHLLKIKIGGHPLGRPSKNEADNRLIAKYIGERNEIEATFGTSKRVSKRTTSAQSCRTRGRHGLGRASLSKTQ